MIWAKANEVYLAVVGDIALGLQCQTSSGTSHTSLKAIAASHIHQVHCTGICRCQASQVAYKPCDRYLQAELEAA